MEIEVLPAVKAWLASLPQGQRLAVLAAIRVLRRDGLQASARWVKRLVASKEGLYELRAPVVEGRMLRVLFAVEGKRAVLLMGGDKTDLLNDWYAVAVPLAEQALRRWRGESSDG